MAFSLLGYTTGSIEVAPLGIRALVGVPATLIGLSPGAMALLYGMRARRGGCKQLPVVCTLESSTEL